MKVHFGEFYIFTVNFFCWNALIRKHGKVVLSGIEQVHNWRAVHLPIVRLWSVFVFFFGQQLRGIYLYKKKLLFCCLISSTSCYLFNSKKLIQDIIFKSARQKFHDQYWFRDVDRITPYFMEFAILTLNVNFGQTHKRKNIPCGSKKTGCWY